MESHLLLFLVVVSFVGGITSGLFAVGGAIILIPALTFLPPIFNLQALPITTITGLASVQSTVGSLSALLTKTKYVKDIDISIWLPISIGTFIGGFSGGISSSYWSQDILLILYFVLLILSIGTLWIHDPTSFPTINNTDQRDPMSLQSLVHVALGIMIGFPSGALGIGGGILISPLLYYIAKISIKHAMANTLVVVFILSTSSFIGKLLTHQVNYLYGMIIGLVAFGGAKIGMMIHHRLSEKTLKKSLLLLLIYTACYTLYDLLH